MGVIPLSYTKTTELPTLMDSPRYSWASAYWDDHSSSGHPAYFL